MSRVKLFELGNGHQCTAVKDNERLILTSHKKRAPKLSPVIGLVIYLDEKSKGEFINFASKIGFASEEDRDRAFDEITANDIISRYNTVIASGKYGLETLPLIEDQNL